MQCSVACANLSVPWLYEVCRRSRSETIGRRDAFSGGNREKPRQGNVLPRRRSLIPRLGFLGGHGMLCGNELRKWTEERGLSSAVVEPRDGARGVRASVLVEPAVLLIRTTVFYILLETGIAGSPRSSSHSGGKGGPLAWIEILINGDPEERRNRELAKVRSKWNKNTKGNLVRRYRVPSKAGGRKLLQAIASLLGDDDTFRDVSTHKGCQLRRENAHAESVCSQNVRALFDELPTPHLVVEITPFPPGPITNAHYEKAEKLEKVLRTGASI